MITHRKIAIAVGFLFIIATLAPILSAIPLNIVPLASFESETNPDYLATISTNQSQVLIGVTLLTIMTVAIVSIPILMYPILKKYKETLALGYVGSRIFEGFFSAINILGFLSLLSLSREFTNTQAPITSYFQTQGALLIAGIDWGSILLDLPFTIGAIVFYYILLKAKLIPQWLSAFGLIGGSLWFATVPFRMFGVFPSTLEILALPIAAQEMILAVWLIIKGFNLGD